jgi:hypothetical protein
MIRDPDLLTEEFYSVTSGYLEANTETLKWMLANLPKPESNRERGIKEAIQWGIEHPYEWKKLQLGPRRLKRSPEQAMADQGGKFDLKAAA